MLNAPLLRSSQSVTPGRATPPVVLTQRSSSMFSEKRLSQSYWTGAARVLSKAARAGVLARANLSRAPSVAPASQATLDTGPSWIEAAITIANTLVGAGVLGLPYALKAAGWAGLLVIIGATAATRL